MSDTVKSTRTVTIVGAVCALIAIIGVFLTWMDTTAIGGLVSNSYTGWDLYSNDLFGDLGYNYAGLAVVVCGVLTLIFMIVSACYSNKKVGMGLQVLSVILTLIALVVTALASGSIGDFVDLGIVADTSVGYGLWVSLVFMVLTFLISIAGAYLEHKSEGS